MDKAIMSSWDAIGRNVSQSASFLDGVDLNSYERGY
jgi:hypothetical protein